ncbi:sensor histidine kinase [Streptosporangium sp. NPDC004379]|uniref:sensor histidine kinase n=1 Tax=Streptosporangium sp. NPDC004379 TaxID=3366189 RepID=UPI0036B2F275
MTYGDAGIVERITPWALGAAVFLLSMASATGSVGVGSELPVPVLAGVAAVSGAAAVHARRSPWPLAAVGAVTYVWLVMWPAAAVASYYAGTRLHRRHLRLYGAVAVVVWLLGGLVSRWGGGYREIVAGTPANVFLLGAALLGLPLVVGMWIRSRRQVLEAAREQARQLRREQALRAERARGQERARIAREMHDVVAHRVSLMVLHAGALEVGATDDRTAEAAALIGGIGREALSDLREVLGVLRSQDPARDPQPTLADLDRLLDQTRALGLTVSRHDEGEARPLGPTAERTAYRVVQEALTNVHRHAGDAETDVFVRYLPAALEVVVRNGPSAEPGRGLPGSGWGLVGLRERVELAGGRLETGPRDGDGFQVLARIPAA